MNKIKENLKLTFTYFEYAAKSILLGVTFIILFTYPNIGNALHVFVLTVTENRELFTAILSSGLVVSLIIDAGIYAGRWLDNNEETLHVKFKIMMYEYIKKIIEEQKKEDGHDGK